MSYQQMMGDADQRIERMEETLSGALDLRDETRNEDRDLTKVRCINDKIAAMQGFLRLSADSRQSLAERAGGEDREAIEHQYTLIVIASQRVQNLRTEATQCAGDILTFSGDTEQTTTVDPDIPDEEDTTESDLANALLDRLTTDTPLPQATPFQ